MNLKADIDVAIKTIDEELIPHTPKTVGTHGKERINVHQELRDIRDLLKLLKETL